MTKSNKLLAIDVEATCWRGDPPNGLPKEVIEIGHTLIDLKSLKIELSESILIKPTTGYVSKFCAELTGIAAEDVADAITFKKAMINMDIEYGNKTAWMSWGDFDKNIIMGQCHNEHIRYPLSGTHINAKYLFSLLTGKEQRIGLMNALRFMGMEFIGTPHSGKDDSFNMARIIIELLGKSRAR